MKTLTIKDLGVTRNSTAPTWLPCAAAMAKVQARLPGSPSTSRSQLVAGRDPGPDPAAEGRQRDRQRLGLHRLRGCDQQHPPVRPEQPPGWLTLTGGGRSEHHCAPPPKKLNQRRYRLSSNCSGDASWPTSSINNLRCDRTLDARAMARIRGGDGAAWCFRLDPALPARTVARRSQVINFYQINNYADQMINQYQMVNVSNSAPNSVLTVGVDERSTNNGTI
jgi:hypothetical protein